MKKFSKIAALSMALALTLGMTVCANESPDAYKELLATAQATADNTKAVDSSGKEVNLTKTAATVDDIKKTDTDVQSPTSALSQTVASAAGADVAKVTEVKLLVMMDITPDPAASGVITVTIPYQVTPAAGKSFVLMHQRGTVWERAKGASYDAAKGEFTFKGTVGVDFSNYAVFEVTEDTTPTPEQTQQPTQQPTQQTETPVSPKTGETVPVAVFAAVILLAGAAVCAKKAQMNH